MRTLLIKDFLCQKRVLPFYGLYSLLFFILFSILGEAPDVSFIFVFSSIMVGFLVISGSFKSDKGRTYRFLMSLPVGRDAVVHEKMLLLLLGTIFGVLSTAVFTLIFSSGFLPLTRGVVDPLDAVRIITGMMCISLLVPFYLRFGVLVVKYFLIGLVGLGVALQVGFILMLASAADGPNLLDKTIAWYTSWSVLQRNTVLFLIALLVFTASYIVSIRVFRKKEL